MSLRKSWILSYSIVLAVGAFLFSELAFAAAEEDLIGEGAFAHQNVQFRKVAFDEQRGLVYYRGAFVPVGDNTTGDEVRSSILEMLGDHMEDELQFIYCGGHKIKPTDEAIGETIQKIQPINPIVVQFSYKTKPEDFAQTRESRAEHCQLLVGWAHTYLDLFEQECRDLGIEIDPEATDPRRYVSKSTYTLSEDATPFMVDVAQFLLPNSGSWAYGPPDFKSIEEGGNGEVELWERVRATAASLKLENSSIPHESRNFLRKKWTDFSPVLDVMFNTKIPHPVRPAVDRFKMEEIIGAVPVLTPEQRGALQRALDESAGG